MFYVAPILNGVNLVRPTQKKHLLTSEFLKSSFLYFRTECTISGYCHDMEFRITLHQKMELHKAKNNPFTEQDDRTRLSV